MPSEKLSKLISQSRQQSPIVPSTSSTLPLEKIQPRGQDTRVTRDEHVAALAESIAAVGLIQPIAVDSHGVLLAGAHRLRAIEVLKENDPQAFEKWFADGVQVRRYDFAVAEDKDLALAIEASENEKRRDYSAAEVRQLADRLVAAGYVDTKGRPKKGEKGLKPALSVITGKSTRQIQRYLSGVDQSEKNRTSVSFLKAALRNLEKWEATTESSSAGNQPAIAQLRSQLPKVRDAIEAILAEEES